MNPLSRKRLHELVDELSEDQVEAADRYLRSLRNQDDSVIRAMCAAPVDNEALVLYCYTGGSERLCGGRSVRITSG